ncbi:MAG: stage II sporulation protein M, partial [Planctomycetota bacterium]
MNVAKLLAEHQPQWRELEAFCDAFEVRGKAAASVPADRRGAEGVAKFASLYRGACADLALADAYQLPPTTVTYLHRLVARAHNQLYRSETLSNRWVDTLFRQAPQQIFADPCVRVASLIFFGLFTLGLVMAYNQNAFPSYVETVIGEDQMEVMQDMYEEPLQGSMSHYVPMAGFYIWNNTGIGLQCFAYGILLLPCLFVLAFNAVFLGSVFGFMAREETVGSDHFYEFVTAHGPFELTAIALAAAAGLRLGLGLFATAG